MAAVSQVSVGPSSGSTVEYVGWVWDFGETIFVQCDRRLYRSDNAGATWSAVSTPATLPDRDGNNESDVSGSILRFAVVDGGGGAYNIYYDAVVRRNSTTLPTGGIHTLFYGLWLNGTRLQRLALLDTGSSSISLGNNHLTAIPAIQSGPMGDQGSPRYVAARYTLRTTSMPIRVTGYRLLVWENRGGAWTSGWNLFENTWHASDDVISADRWRFAVLPGSPPWSMRLRRANSGNSGLWRGLTPVKSIGGEHLLNMELPVFGRTAICEDGAGGSYFGYIPRSAEAEMRLLYRNPSDTATSKKATVSLPSNSPAFALGFLTATRQLVCLIEHNNDIQYKMYDPSNDTWDASWETLVDASSDLTASTARIRGITPTAATRLRVVVPDTTNWQMFTLSENHEPIQPTWVTTTGVADPGESLHLEWDFNDPDPIDVQGAYTLSRLQAGVTTYWNAGTSSWQATTHKNSSASTEVTLPSGWGGGDNVSFAVRTWDDSDNGPSPWSELLVIVPSAPVNPTITAPTDGSTVPGSTTLEWTVTEQTAYRVRILGDSGGNPNPMVVLSDSLRTDEPNIRSHEVTFASAGTRHFELTTWNNHNLPSVAQYRRVVVVITPPAKASVICATHDDYGEITVHPSQPAPTGNQPPIEHLEIWRRVDGDNGDGIIIGVIPAAEGWYTDRALVSGEEYEYRCRSVARGSTTWSDWTDGDVKAGDTAPGNVQNLSLSVSDGEVTATWSAPTSTGGLPAPIYRYEWSHDGDRWFNSTTTTKSVTIPGQLKQRFFFRVAAVNAVGRGPWAVSNVDVGYQTPDRPTSLALSYTAGVAPTDPDNLTATWTAPTQAGSSAITKYVLAVTENPYPGGIWTEHELTDLASLTLTVAVTGETGPWYVRVKAVNSSGGGRWSAIADVASSYTSTRRESVKTSERSS